jgi:hypothetical protein
VAPQSGAKDQFYYTVYYITVNSNCETWRISKNLEKIVENRGKFKINAWVICAFFCFLK